ncbi:Hypothetical_protein [Hexamita inflata]|uniref:Hypothetical_protein n=1 Tax=Hexamita inflata TaxID=28002 RepID=A0AA86UZR5_9EUKA|nr:Hypothetical protein HINF_LOCUS58247 [Hexamita inflata]
MPYVIVDKEDVNLELQWKDDEAAIPYNINELKTSYYHIHINGVNNSQFNEFELLTRSNQIRIYNCSVDLNKINNNNIVHLIFNNCVCSNNFNQIKIITLVLVNSQLKVEQLQHLVLQYLSVEQKQTTTFDYWNCGQLQCKLEHLQLSEVQINLSDLSGFWVYAFIGLCDITGHQINENFGIKTLEFNITSCDEMSLLKYVKCDKTCVYAKAEDSAQYWSFEENSTYQIHSITLENYNIDVTNIPNNIDYCQIIVFFDCNFIGKPRNALNNLKQVKVVVSQLSKLDIVHVLSGIQPVEFRIMLQDIQIQTLNLDKCYPTLLQLTDCSIDMAQLHGQWQYLMFINIIFTNTKEDCKIIATNNIMINGSDYKYMHNFESKQVVLSNISIESFPQAKKMYILNSNINFTQEQNNTVEKLFIKNCTFKQFSLKIMKNVLGVQFSHNSKLQVSLNKFIQQRNKSTKMNRKNVHRIQNEMWKRNQKQTCINELKASIKLTMEKIQFAQRMNKCKYIVIIKQQYFHLLYAIMRVIKHSNLVAQLPVSTLISEIYLKIMLNQQSAQSFCGCVNKFYHSYFKVKRPSDDRPSENNQPLSAFYIKLPHCSQKGLSSKTGLQHMIFGIRLQGG